MGRFRLLALAVVGIKLASYAIILCASPKQDPLAVPNGLLFLAAALAFYLEWASPSSQDARSNPEEERARSAGETKP